MLAASRTRIAELVGEDQLVLDVGGGASPFERADWVVDLLPYEDRGRYGYPSGPERRERFSGETWVSFDICGPERWPFPDDRFDFAICSHTLEDVRDPVWVCAELCRVARAGYIEVPSRLEEQSYGFQGPWVGWNHHRWLVDVDPGAGRIQFVYKNPILSLRPSDRFPAGHRALLSEEERVEQLWWEGSFGYRERVFLTAAEYDEYVASFVGAHRRHVPWRARMQANRQLAAARARMAVPGLPRLGRG
jgi:hypothetical protein